MPGGHNVFSSAGSWLTHVFGGGQPKEPPKDADGKPIPYDPNRPPNATGQGQPPEPVEAKDKEDEKKTNPLKKIFGICGGKKKDSDKPKPADAPHSAKTKPD